MDPYAHTHAYRYASAYRHAHTHRNAQAQSHTNSKAYRYADLYSASYRHPLASADGYTDHRGDGTSYPYISTAASAADIHTHIASSCCYQQVDRYQPQFPKPVGLRG